MVSADTLAGKTKAEVRDVIMPIAEEQVGKFDSFTDEEYKATKYDLVGHRGKYGEAPLAVTKGFAKGLTLDMHKAFREDIGTNITKMNSEMKYTLLEEIDGAKVYLQQIKMPMFISNRATISIFHTIENDDGSLIFFNTSVGNEDLYEKYKDKVGSDVQAINHFNYTKLVPGDGGCEVTMVTSMDVAGSIPDMIKQKSAGRMLRAPEKMIHLMITGEVLKD